MIKQKKKKKKIYLTFEFSKLKTKICNQINALFFRVRGSNFHPTSILYIYIYISPFFSIVRVETQR